MSERLRCCVPFCRKTTKREPIAAIFDDPEWICGDHWRAVPRKDRAIYARVKRKARKSGVWNAVARIWARCKRLAVERGAGL